MLRHSSKQSAALKSSRGPFLLSSRCVHWYHNYKAAGAPKDRYELYNRKREFGQDEITDHDRNPHLYWGIWQGRATVQRVINQWGFSKDLKPDKVKRDFEKFTYFGKLDALYFLQDRRENYPWIEDDGDDAIGYNTDDGVPDARVAHPDYGKRYKDASAEYRELVLQDHNHGRPVYEWQVPHGLDDAYGYREVSTSVDVLGNELALNNLEFEWSISPTAGDAIPNSTLLTHNMTGQKLLLCDIKDAAHAIHGFHPSTCVMPCGADKVLDSVKGKFSPSSRTDLYGTAVALGWSALWMLSPYWPTESFLSIVFGSGLIALNSTAVFRTFFHPSDTNLKAAFAACRDADCEVVLGDWLNDDYDERKSIVEPFDDIAHKLNDPEYNSRPWSKGFFPHYLHQTDEAGIGFVKTVRSITGAISKAVDLHQKDGKKTDDVSTEDWMTSYRDAINNRRIDLFAHVLNNVEGDKIVVPVANIDNIPPDLAINLVIRRMTGNVRIESSPMKFDENFERVGIEF